MKKVYRTVFEIFWWYTAYTLVAISVFANVYHKFHVTQRRYEWVQYILAVNITKNEALGI